MNMIGSESLIIMISGTLIAIVFAFLLFLIFRAFTLWYYRINDIVDLLVEQTIDLREIQDELFKKEGEERIKRDRITLPSGKCICMNCHKINDGENTHCKYCNNRI